MLAETGPAAVVMAWLAAALLVATAVPVARVFVLGPGSGRTDALAWPIVAFGPAIVGFTLLGLASTPARPASGDGIGHRQCERLGCGDHQRGRTPRPRSCRVARAGAGGQCVARNGRRCGGRWLLLDAPVCPASGCPGRCWLDWLLQCWRAGWWRPVPECLRMSACWQRCWVRSPLRCCVSWCSWRRYDFLPCAARPALGAATPCTVGRRRLIMKIAQLLTASTGIGRHVASIAPRLERRGHQVRVFCPEDTAEAQGFKGSALMSGRWPACAVHWRRSCACTWAEGRWLGLPIAWMFRVPLVVTWHNAVLGDGLAPAAVRQTLRAVAMGADLTLGASRDLVAQARARNARLSPIAAPALPAAKISRDEQRRALGAVAQDTVILTVSRLAPKEPGHGPRHCRGVYDRPDLRFCHRRRWAGARYVATPHCRGVCT